MKDTKDFSVCVANLEKNVRQWERQLQEQPDPASFREAVAGLRTALDQLGRAGFLKLAQAGETTAETVVREGTVYRFKQRVEKQWLTLWGKVSVSRRLFQPDRGGPSWVALDAHCGMAGRFMVPELERVTAFLGARLVPAEVEDSLAELLPQGPSCTAIQHLLAAVGHHAEEAADALEEAMEAQAPLETAADTLVVGWDGVHVPLRQAAPKRGRPPERPQASDPPATPTAWKEAAVGMVATYATPLDPENEAPERIDVRYASRMPEAKMQRLIDGVVDLTEQTLQRGSFRFRVFLADGKREIWRRVDEQPVFADFMPILDFYHAADHLSKAAEHLFGKASSKANHWFTSWRHKLCHEEGAVDRLLRSLAYHRGQLKKGSQRYGQVTGEMGYFRHNRDKMDYAAYQAAGLIISSGPVEAAAKTIVGHRLKRSGMRWTKKGGQQILNLRVHVQSKRWDTFWDWHLQHSDQQVAAAAA